MGIEARERGEGTENAVRTTGFSALLKPHNGTLLPKNVSVKQVVHARFIYVLPRSGSKCIFEFQKWHTGCVTPGMRTVVAGLT